MKNIIMSILAHEKYYAYVIELEKEVANHKGLNENPNYIKVHLFYWAII